MNVSRVPKVQRAVGGAVIGAATAVLALLALAAMHGLPAMAMPSDAGMHSAAAGDPLASAALDAVAAPAAAGHTADGVPSHGHSLVHLCLAVLIAALTVILARWLRPRALAFVAPLSSLAQQPLLTLDIGPPNRLALCVVRC